MPHPLVKPLHVYTGSNTMINEYSCVCLHGNRKPQERKAKLQAFKVGVTVSCSIPLVLATPPKDEEVRFLICTDVAARGIDIRGVPFVVNMTLPQRQAELRPSHREGGQGEAYGAGPVASGNR